MPQVDLESLVVSVCSGGGACGDRKIACETLADGANQNQHKLDSSESDPSSEQLPADFPPESFWLSKDAELDWLDRNAFIARQGSTKGTSNSTNLNPNIHPPSTPGNSSSSSHSQRFSNLKSMIGLPKPQNSCFVDAKSRRHHNTKPGNAHLFPKRSGSIGKSTSSVAEPGSPKVSCMGRVRSKRDRSRRLRSRQRSKRSAEPELKKAKSERRRAESGFLASFRAIFKPCSKSKKQSKTEAAAASALHRESSSSSRKSDAAARASDIRNRLPSTEREAARRTNGGGLEAEPAAAASLGGMMKFSSGRRSAEWASRIDVA
ncbi:unnamed protein product [Linum tenue]|uniref:Uncharacterized protein n=2 Tax=Linum tenue TaxID=586396 RepID=A0AAV0Q6L2_9ROSI|nr:unnamed protein product [Linum tenue]